MSGTTFSRHSARIAAITLLLGAIGASGASRATATPTPPETSWGAIVACGYGSAVPVLGSTGSNTCESLPQAVSDAEALGGTFASAPPIVLMPGDYCPISLPKLDWGLTITGMGMAGVDTSGGPVTLPSSEAELSTFKYDSAHCSGGTSGGIDNTLGPTTQGLVLQNLAIEGASGGPAWGVYSDSQGSALTLRDVLIEGLSTAGLYYTGTNLSITHSALINDGTGAYLSGVNSGDLYASTVADNTNDGLELNAIAWNIDDSTIAHNGTGVKYDSGPFSSQDVGNIVAANSTDCSGFDWEYYNGSGGSANGSGYNLLGNCSPEAADATDVAYNGTDHPIPDAVDNGGPTLSIAPTSQAVAAMTPTTCFESQDSDQREYIWDPSSATQPKCDIGAVQSAAATTPDIELTGTGDFGDVVVGSPTSNNFDVENDLSGMFSVNSVSITGSAFSIIGDGCTQKVVFKEEGGYCVVTVQANPTQADTSPETGTLKVVTSLGEKDLALSVTGTGSAVTAPGAPTSLHGSGGDGKVSLAWTAPSDNGGAALQSYEIDDSTDGTNWTKAGQVDGTTTSDDITGLTNGTSYQFEVTAFNGTDTSAPSNVLTLTPDAAPTRGTPALTAPAKAAVVYGKSVTVHTTMKADGLPVPNTGVQLQKQVPGSTAWTSAGTAHTNSSGVASLTIKPTRTLTYRWAFLGNTSIAPGVSSTAKIQVAQSVTIALSAHSVTHGKKVKVYGLVAPGAKGQKVTVQRKVGSTWKKIGTATLKVQKLPNGKKTLGYLLTYKPSAKGKQILRATKAKTVSVSAGTSKTVTLKVK